MHRDTKDYNNREEGFGYDGPRQGQAINRQVEPKYCAAPIRQSYQEPVKQSYQEPMMQNYPEPSSYKHEGTSICGCRESKKKNECKCSCLPPKDQYECCPAMTAYLTGLSLGIATAPTNYIFNYVDLGEFRSRGNSVFTVPEDGRYLISYTVTTIADILFTTQVAVDGDPLPGSVFTNLAGLLSSHTQTTIADLQCGDKISLQYTGVTAAASLSSDSLLASLTVVKVC